ncbi:MAG TPA: NADPH:quinone reductase [Myxococcaceae bacterium]|nr:NADPH:quinone reductase [Myxococcaceae bacterium]
MLAGWYESLGPAAEVIKVGQLEDPVPGPGEVRVQLHASGVNPSDVKRRSGAVVRQMPFPRIVPHSDGAGIIDRVGEGVSKSRLGERVWVFNGAWKRPMGTAAEYIALPASQVVPLPDDTSFDEGACLGIPAMTAHRCVFAEGPVKGRTVLVTGGAGAVGGYAVQLARWGGATVLSTVSSESKGRIARDFGAHEVIDYKREDVARRVLELTGGQGVDRIVDVDVSANLGTDLAVLKDRGTISVYAAPAGVQPPLPVHALMMKNVTVRFVLVYDMEDEAKAQACRDITAWLESGTANHLIAARFPLEQLVLAHELQESGGQVGNVVVRVMR